MAERRSAPRRLVALACAMLSFALLSPSSARAGDSIYGTVISVKSASEVTLDYGSGRYAIRIVGVDASRNAATSKVAQLFVTKLVLGKKARLRFFGRGPNGEMMGRLMTDDSVIGIKDVGLELVRAGMAQRINAFDYTYGELSRAEKEAQGAHRGLWSTARPQ